MQGNPQATIEKMQTMERAALAPAQPSPQDNTVAAREEAQARMDLMQSKLADTGQGKSTPPGSLINDYA